MHPADPQHLAPGIEIVSTRPWFRKTFEALVRNLRLDPVPGALVVLDLGGLDGASCAAALASCRDGRPDARVACVIDQPDDALVETLMAAGAAGVLVKASVPAALVRSLELLIAGGTCRPAPTVEIRTPDVPAALRASLSAREQRMLRLVAGGESVAAVARTLHLTPRKVVHDMRRIAELVRGREP